MQEARSANSIANSVPGWGERDFPAAARVLLQDSQLRKNVKHATDVISNKRFLVVRELEDWQQLRDAGSRIREHVLRESGRLPAPV